MQLESNYGHPSISPSIVRYAGRPPCPPPSVYIMHGISLGHNGLIIYHERSSHAYPNQHGRRPCALTERLAGQVPRAADLLRADHHRPGGAGLYRVGLPGGG